MPTRLLPMLLLALAAALGTTACDTASTGTESATETPGGSSDRGAVDAPTDVPADDDADHRDVPIDRGDDDPVERGDDDPVDDEDDLPSTVCDGATVLDPEADVVEVTLAVTDLNQDSPWECGSQPEAAGHDVLVQITAEEDVVYRAIVLNGYYHELRLLTACPSDCAELPPAEPWATTYTLWLEAGATYVVAASLQPMDTESSLPVGLRFEKLGWDPEAPGQTCDNPIEVTGEDLPLELAIDTSGLAPDLDTSCLPEVTEPVDFVVAFTPDVTGAYDLAVESTTKVGMVHSATCEFACTAPTATGSSLTLNLEAGVTTFLVVRVNVPVPLVAIDAAPEVTLTISEGCLPDCDGKECGDNGCGQSCGSCGAYLACEDESSSCVLDEFACYADPLDPHAYAPGGCIIAAGGCEELPVFVPWDYGYDYSAGSAELPIDPQITSCSANAPTALSFGWNSYHAGWVMVENGWQLLDWNAGEFFNGAGGPAVGPGDMLMEPWTAGPTVLKLGHAASPGPVRVVFTWGGGVTLLEVSPWTDDMSMEMP